MVTMKPTSTRRWSRRILSFRVIEEDVIDEAQKALEEKEEEDSKTSAMEMENGDAVEELDDAEAGADADAMEEDAKAAENATEVSTGDGAESEAASATGQPLFKTGYQVEVLAHERTGKDGSAKMHFGGVGHVMEVHEVSLPGGGVRFAYDVQYTVGGGAISKADEAFVQKVRGRRAGAGDKAERDAIKAAKAAARGKRNLRDDEINKNMTPLQRCGHLLSKFLEDPMCDLFLEPVSSEMFPDYEEIVSNPMDLGTIRDKMQKTGTRATAPTRTS